MSVKRKPRPIVTRDELKRADGYSVETAELAEIIRDSVKMLRRELGGRPASTNRDRDT